MAVKIYAGNLSNKLSDSKLECLFGQFEMVECAKPVMDHHAGKSRGFAFVEMTQPTEAYQAIRSLNGKDKT